MWLVEARVEAGRSAGDFPTCVRDQEVRYINIEKSLTRSPLWGVILRLVVTPQNTARRPNRTAERGRRRESSPQH
jgi:hypothetical protein